MLSASLGSLPQRWEAVSRSSWPQLRSSISLARAEYGRSRPTREGSRGESGLFVSHPVTIVRAKLPLKGCKILQKGARWEISLSPLTPPPRQPAESQSTRGAGQGLSVHLQNPINEPIQPRRSYLPSMSVTGHAGAPKESLQEHGCKLQLSFPPSPGRGLQSTSGSGLELQRYRNVGLGRNETP